MALDTVSREPADWMSWKKVSADTYCVYDVKTGTSGLSRDRIIEILAKLPLGVLVYIVEVRPFE